MDLFEEREWKSCFESSKLFEVWLIIFFILFQVFKRQLEIAKIMQMPVCLHIRGTVTVMKAADAILKVSLINTTFVSRIVLFVLKL